MPGRIQVMVKPNSKETKILKNEKGILHIALREPPENNKANKELLKLIKKTFGKPVRILHGLKSKEKVLEFS